MKVHPAFHIFLWYSDVKREKISARKLEQIAISENLDDFLFIENSEPGIIEYSTTYGFRILCPERPELSQFVVAKKGMVLQKPEICLIFACKPPVNYRN